MKTKIKIQVPLSKPRNPLALAARMRNAGAHEAPHPQRTARRKARQSLRLQGLRDREEDDSTSSD
ncbi:hypothetical protein ACO0K2_07750 [Undibacterium sp. MH2W]|uniref:hypothetical protein n=1 Tax=Undibacterium sp. MH2W TaxID=3413044 RepID=UPI003BF0E9B4